MIKITRKDRVKTKQVFSDIQIGSVFETLIKSVRNVSTNGIGIKVNEIQALFFVERERDMDPVVIVFVAYETPIVELDAEMVVCAKK